MFYEVNVAEIVHYGHSRGVRYRHLFATAERSLTTREEADRVYAMLKERFPPDQYKVSMTFRQVKSQVIYD